MFSKEVIMLVLTRKLGEKIIIGDDIVVTLVRIQGDKARLGIEAPRNIPVHREEVQELILAAAAADRAEANANRQS
jgi:carbon storage regulator